MARPKKIQEDETDEQSGDSTNNQPQKANEFPLIMSIAKLLTLTTEQQQLFRANGGTTTEN